MTKHGHLLYASALEGPQVRYHAQNIDTIEFKKSILFGLFTNLRRRFADEMSLSNFLNLYTHAKKLQSETLYAETVS